MTDTTSSPVYRQLLSGTDRSEDTAKRFGIRFPLYIESFAFDTAASLSEDYAGGLWAFYALSNGGFYMAPELPETFRVVSDNSFEGSMSSDAFGITACLYAFSMLSFSPDAEFAESCARHYHQLREYLLGHAESRAVFMAID